MMHLYLQLRLWFFMVVIGSTMVITVANAQKTDLQLTKKINELLAGFNGQAGVYVYDLEKNNKVAINADTVFSTASMVKIPILLGIMDKINKNELAYHQPLVYSDSLLYAGVDILGSFKNNETIELSKAVMLMLTMSDNTASLWLQSLAGTGTRINQLVDSLGFKATRVNSRTPGREANRTQFGWGQTTPREMALLFVKIANGQLLNQEISNRMLTLLSRNYWDEEALSQIPAGVFIASKNGAVDASRSEVAYVNGKKSRYVFCICTQNNADKSWTSSNEAWVLTKKLSALLWQYYGKGRK